MTTRKQHLAEMRYALAHGCSLVDARKALTWTRRRAAEELLRELENRPVVAGRDLERPRSSDTAPWMMRD